ncbi:diguanylate cyclase [Comamonas antarctica]|uniref:GGDEF domain-containing protein n=2 Tax=Comamonas antarctica TaxID=2743470 RepID=UPI0028EF2324|nr:diguanylate cyclase [Comamonas antarctica]
MALALDQLEVAMCVFDARHKTLLWNETFLQFFPEHAGHVHEGEDYRENLRRFYLARLSAQELPSMERYIEEGIQRHHLQQRAFEFDHHGYRVRAASVSLGPLGRVRLWRKTAPLLTGMQDRINPRLVQLPARISADTARALESLADGILMVDDQDRAVWANHAFLVLYGQPDIESLGACRFEEIYAQAWRGAEPSADYARGVAILTERQRFSGAPYVLALPHNRWVRILELRGTQANGSSFFSHVDVTAARRQQDELRKMTRHLASLAGKDALTGLANRRRFDEVLEAQCRAYRQSETMLALLMLDVDHFKQVNDAFGHPFGDEVLKSFATVLTHVVQRPGSLVARYGGEEFAILLPETDAASAARLAEFLRQQVAAMALGNEHTGAVRITVSIGIASAIHCAPDYACATLVDMADRALYDAKRSGRNQVAVAG